jgi:hypothetical protein
MKISGADLSTLQTYIEVMHASLVKATDSAKPLTSFEHILDQLFSLLKENAPEQLNPGLASSDQNLDQLSDDHDIAIAAETSTGPETSNNESLKATTSPIIKSADALEKIEPISPQVGMSLRRATQTPGHKWYQANVISVYDSASGYQEHFGSHKVNGIEIIPGAEGYDKEVAAAYLAQARQRAAAYWNG